MQVSLIYSIVTIKNRFNMNEMTIEDLYRWAVENKCADYKIRIKYRDEGGEYFGCDDEMYLTIDETDKTVKL